MSDAFDDLTRQTWLAAVRGSEQRITSSISTTESHGSYDVFRTDAFPDYYSGNGIAILEPSVGDLAHWVAVFHRHFDAARYRHVTLCFNDDTSRDTFATEAEQAGFSESIEIAMAVPAQSLAEANDIGASVALPRLLQSPADMDALYRLHLEESRDLDWFVDDPDFRGLFTKTLTVSERVGIQWLGIDGPQGDLISALGYFDHADVCRLQEIITAEPHRRQGLASRLIREVAIRAVARGVGAVGLITEVDSEAYGLYRRLGFVDLGREITLMSYPRAGCVGLSNA